MIHDTRMFQETQHSQLLTHLCFTWRKIILPPGSQLEPLKAAAASHCPIAWLPHEVPSYVPAMTGRHGDSSKWVPHGQDNSELFSMSNCFSHMENVWVISPLHMGVSKNRGKTPKMDGEDNGKPYQNGWFGGTPIFGNIHIIHSPLADWGGACLTLPNCCNFDRILIEVGTDLHSEYLTWTDKSVVELGVPRAPPHAKPYWSAQSPNTPSITAKRFGWKKVKACPFACCCSNN